MRNPQLLVLDIDNTLFDWLPYYAESNTAVLKTLAELITVPFPQLVEEFKQLMEHFDRNNSFVLPQLPSLAQMPTRPDSAMICQQCTAVFLQKANAALTPYPGVKTTLATIKCNHPHIKIVALTDSPALEAVWKITRLGLDPYFDGVYGLSSPPIVPAATVLAEILAACQIYHGAVKRMPPEFEKPSTQGLAMVMNDFGLDSIATDSVIYAGDNLKKDIALGKKVGAFTCWSEFSMSTYSPSLQQTLNLSPASKIKQNLPNREDMRLYPDVTLHKFSDILNHLF